MPTAPDFPQRTIDLLSQRSAMICNNPECLTVTVGPSDASEEFKLKLGEAAHIKAARKGEARWDEKMTDLQRADICNGIWLCASCHTMIDKNDGADFPVAGLAFWKQEHHQMINALLRAHRSPISYLRKVTKEGQIAQNIVDIADQHGALFQPIPMEDPYYVIKSVKQLRKRYNAILKEVVYDLELKGVLQHLIEHLRELMNFTSTNEFAVLDELPAMRNRVGLQLKILRDSYGCKIPQAVSAIVPN